ncbi:hypothetical protein B0H11DRAFT_2215255 [Mycena galericulata]|nr:hypothetical protein B0H11DRAFT_2215255 [Mycena galericulata]
MHTIKESVTDHHEDRELDNTSGYIQVTGQGVSGYVSTVSSTYRVAPSVSAAVLAQLPYASPFISVYNIFDRTSPGDAATPCFGANGYIDGAGYILFRFRLPRVRLPSSTMGSSNPGPTESQIWSDCTTLQLKGQWTNADGTLSPTTIFYTGGNLGITGDLAAYNTDAGTYGDNFGVAVTLTFLPGGQ